MKYGYFPGCVAEDTCKELDISMRLIANRLGIELVKLEDATCCGAGYIQEYNHMLGLFLNGRTFALAEELGVDTIITICNSCQLALTKANMELKNNAESLKKTNDLLSKIDLQYSGNIEVKHLLQILVEDYGLDKLSDIKQVSLDLNVAPFYGCQLLRPPDIENFDNAEDPRSLEDLIRALGGNPVDYHGRIKCCGFHVLMVNEDISLRMSGHLLQEAKANGADCVVTTCPLCHLVLDMYQPRIEKKLYIKLKLPIMHLPQLVGLALGFSPKELALNKHIVNATNISRRQIAIEKVANSTEISAVSNLLDIDAKDLKSNLNRQIPLPTN